MKKRTDQIIPALDNMNTSQVKEYLTSLDGHFPIIKIGIELFYREGREFINEIAKNYQKKVFLDLKLHDIPNTVAKAISSLAGLPIEFLTIHLSGGEEMIKAAMAARDQFIPDTKLLGVSYLTSLDDHYFKRIQDRDASEVPEAFKRLFELAKETKIDGIVCSALELESIADYSFLKVCPGIRFSDEITNAKNLGDQKRVMDPHQALEKGASFLVMGRSLAHAKNLRERINQINR